MARSRKEVKKKGKISCKGGGFPKGMMLEREGRRWGEEQHSLIPLLIGRWWALLALLLLQAAAEILAEGLCSPLLPPTLVERVPSVDLPGTRELACLHLCPCVCWCARAHVHGVNPRFGLKRAHCTPQHRPRCICCWPCAHACKATCPHRRALSLLALARLAR